MEDKEKLNLMEEQEFVDYLHNTLKLIYFDCVRRFDSVNRAFRRGQITSTGYILPKRPYHHRKNTCKRKGRNSRAANEEKKRIYERIRQTNHRGL